MIESKINFISFLTLGFIEFGCIVYGFQKYFKNPFLITKAKFYVDEDNNYYDDFAFMTYDIIFVALLIYGALQGLIYLFKAIMLLAVFIYFKIYGGLQD